jgi:hypothetical protein
METKGITIRPQAVSLGDGITPCAKAKAVPSTPVWGDLGGDTPQHLCRRREAAGSSDHLTMRPRWLRILQIVDVQGFLGGYIA